MKYFPASAQRCQVPLLARPTPASSARGRGAQARAALRSAPAVPRSFLPGGGRLPETDTDAALTVRLGDLPAALRRSITWDQGSEMARHLSITQTLGASVYFCDSHSPWQRGSNENTNGLLRDHFPKGTNLGVHTLEHLLAVENELNNRPRMVLDDRTPQELFTALLASESPSVLRR